MYHIHNEDETLLKKWIEISQKIGKYKDEAAINCNNEWYEKFDDRVWDNPPGEPTIRFWAKIDNPKE